MQKEAEPPQKNEHPKENPSTEKYGKGHFVKSVFLRLSLLLLHLNIPTPLNVTTLMLTII